jgi:hypothetical protein
MIGRSLLLSVVLCGAACGASNPPAATDGHHGAHPDFPACSTLAKTCHAHDKDSENAHACHVLGHRAASNEECEAKRAECLALCGNGDGGA